VNLRWLPAFVFCVAGLANAQSPKSDLHVRVVNIDGSPVAGALVALVDQSNQVVAEGLSSESGLRLLSALPGTYKVRVRRIGFSPFVSESVSIPRSDPLTLRVESTRISLNTIVVYGRGECRGLAADTANLGTIWSEIVKALQASRFTSDDLAGIGKARLYSKDIGVNGEVFRADSTIVRLTAQRPFGIADPASLAMQGYVRGDIYRGWEFFGADEAVLLSPEFAGTHCFTIVRDAKRQGELGLGFKPVRNRKVADIQGVLWLDEKSSELREMVFEYTNTGFPLRVAGGGQTKFRRFPSGAWLVDEWKLSMPRVEVRRRSVDQFRVHSSDYVLVGFTETGGSLFLDSSVASTEARGTSVAGMIFDNLNRKPLAGAGVTVDGVTVRSDRNGRFRFSNVSVGTHSISFSHPTLRSLGLTAIETEFEAAVPATEVFLVVPSLGAVWPRLCRDTASTRAGDDRRGVLHGTVRDGAGRPVDGGRVRITWREEVSLRALREIARHQQPDLKLEVVTDNAGQYSACGFSSRTRGLVEVIVGKRAASRDRFDFAQAPVLQRDLVVAGTAPKSLVAVSGMVSDASGHPIPHTYIFDRANAQSVVSDSRGAFHLSASPVGGVIPLSFRSQSFLARDTLLEPGNKNAFALRVALDPARGTDSLNADDARIGYFATLDRNGFYRRRSLATPGIFVTADEIARNNPLRITELLRDLPNIEVISPQGSSSDEDYPASQEHGCALTLLVDGKPATYRKDVSDSTNTFAALVPPDLVLGVELYPVASAVPEQFARYSISCGMIAVWTSRDGH
jgi:hypothetical protein